MNHKTIKPKELLLLYVSFTNADNGKRRPILVIKNANQELWFFSITSKYFQKSTRIKIQYYPLQDWKLAGLAKPSYIDIKSLRKTPWSNLPEAQYIGQITERDIKGLSEFILTYDGRAAEINHGKE